MISVCYAYIFKFNILPHKFITGDLRVFNHKISIATNSYGPKIGGGVDKSLVLSMWQATQYEIVSKSLILQ